MEAQMRNVRAAAVYVVESDAGVVKIGRSAEPERRIRQLATASGAVLRLRHTTPIREDASLVEALAHQALTHKRRAGEWFEVTSEEAVAAIGSALLEIERRRDIARCKVCRPARLQLGAPTGSRFAKPRVVRFTEAMNDEITRLAAERNPIDGADESTVIRELIAKGLGWRK